MNPKVTKTTFDQHNFAMIKNCLIDDWTNISSDDQIFFKEWSKCLWLTTIFF
jgi:hypothetical protein